MTEVQKCLAQNIKHHRKRKNMTQEQLAEKAGTAASYIGTIEIGKKNPSPKMLEKIADALEIPSLSLFQSGIDTSAFKKEISADELIILLNANVKSTVEKYFAW